MQRTALVRSGLLFNAVFSTLCAGSLLLDPGRFAAELALPELAMQGLGASLAGFVVWLVFLATRTRVRLLEVLGTTVADAGWVIGSAGLLATWSGITDTGWWMVVGVASAVAIAATLQFVGLLRTIAEPDTSLGTTHRIEFVQDVDVPRTQFWKNLSDLESIRHHSDGLTESFLRHGRSPGVGAERECAAPDGTRWAEKVTGWRPGEGLDVTFLAEEEGFPFPASRMVGGWRLEAVGPARTRVTLWWSIRPKGMPGFLLVPLMAFRVERDVPSVFASLGRPRAPASLDRTMATS